MHVCIDDYRTLGDVVIRHPEVAITALRRLQKQITRTYWDNDMGGGWELEGRNLIKQYLTDISNAGIRHEVVIVTSNTVAASDMAKTLASFGYVCVDSVWTIPK
jgi:hypothetical protein